MDGIETIKRVREQNNEIPFIFYTGHGDDLLIKEAVKYGAFEFLNKPELDNLEEVVERGLKFGFKIKNDDFEDPQSSYRKLLKDVYAKEE